MRIVITTLAALTIGLCGPLQARTLDPLEIAQMQHLSAVPTPGHVDMSKYRDQQKVTRLRSFQPKHRSHRVHERRHFHRHSSNRHHRK